MAEVLNTPAEVPRETWRDRVRWFFLGARQCNNHASHALQPLVTVFAFFLLQVIAAGINQQGRGPLPGEYLGTYLVLGLCSIVAMFTMSRVTVMHPTEGRKYCYDRGTSVTGSLLCWISFVLLITFLILGGCGHLPDQQPPTIGAPNVREKDNVTCGLAGLEFDFLLSDSYFGGRIPKDLTLYAHIDPDFAGGWEVVSNGVRIEQYSSAGTLVPLPVTPAIERSHDQEKPIGIRIQGLSTGPLYRFTVYLQPTGDEFHNDVEEIDKYDNDNPTEEEKRKMDAIKSKWKKRAEKAAREIYNRLDAIRVTT